jgi:hypothetical protein
MTAKNENAHLKCPLKADIFLSKENQATHPHLRSRKMPPDLVAFRHDNNIIV